MKYFALNVGEKIRPKIFLQTSPTILFFHVLKIIDYFVMSFELKENPNESIYTANSMSVSIMEMTKSS